MAAWNNIVKDGSDAFGFPFGSLASLLANLAITKGPGLQRALSQHAIRCQSVHHVPQYGIVDAVTDEAHDVVPEKLANEPSGPAFGKISQPEITACHDQPA